MDEILVGAVVAATALAASSLAAVAGFGGAVVMLPVLVWAFDVRDAIPVLTVAQLMGNLSRVWLKRQELDWSVVRRFALGAVPTAAAGGVVFATAPAAALIRLLGVFLVLVVAYRHTPWGRQANMTLKGFLPLGCCLRTTLGGLGHHWTFRSSLLPGLWAAQGRLYWH